MDFIKDCLDQVKIFARLFQAIYKELDKINSRLYRLEENQKLQKAHEKIQDEELNKLRLAARNGREGS